MAGTQVRWASEIGPTSIEEKSREAAASAAAGTRPAEAVKRRRCAGRHTSIYPNIPALPALPSI
jgi:hypothetical protein